MAKPNPAALIWGAKGHAKVLRPILEASGYIVTAIYDSDPNVPSPFSDVNRLPDEAALDKWIEDCDGETAFALAIGGHKGRDRLAIGERLKNRGLVAPVLVHPRAWKATTAAAGDGSQVVAMAGLSEHATIGRYCIINTNASIDHDCRLGDGVHVMPGATVAGEVCIEDFVTVGSNATVLPRLRIGAGAYIGAGAVVTKDIVPGAVVTGNPARPLKNKR